MKISLPEIPGDPIPCIKEGCPNMTLDYQGGLCTKHFVKTQRYLQWMNNNKYTMTTEQRTTFIDKKGEVG